MFTGLIEEIGRIDAIRDNPSGRQLTICARQVTENLKVGDSLAVDGVCLSVIACDPQRFTVQAVSETLERSTLQSCAPGRPVNLERAMAAQGRFGGHFVQGHVDGVGSIVSRQPKGQAANIGIEIPPELARFTVPKGSVAVDGISLTIAQSSGVVITIAVIPLTLNETTLGLKRVGDPVNIEVDLIAKYVQRLLSGEGNDQPLTEKIRRWGYQH